jgi:cephalosporin-C deacetylase
MPSIDKPLHELRTYKGCSPCPEDIDAFWDEAIREMQAVAAQVEMVPAGFQTSFAECLDLYFTGVGNARIHAKYARPRHQAGKQPALLKFHGYSSNSGDWFDLLPYAAEGFHIAALDCRGQAGKSQDTGVVHGNTYDGHITRGLEDGPKKLLFRSIYLDTAQLAALLMDMPGVDVNRIGCFGLSQGGALSLACASLEPRIKRIAAQYPFLCDFRRIWEMDLDINSYREIRYWFKAIDPLHEREEEFFNTLAYIDIQNLVHRIKGKTLMLTGLLDEICPPSTQFAAYNKIKGPKEMLIYPDYGHEPMKRASDEIFKFLTTLNM